MERKNILDFLIQTSSATLGTIIGIIVTLGTTYCQHNSENEQMERTAALMVIHNIDDFCEDLEKRIKKLEARDSINMLVWQHFDDNTLDKVSDDTLELVVQYLMSFDTFTVDNTAPNIFCTNIDTWKSIGNSAFVECVGKCFNEKDKMIKINEDLEKARMQQYYNVQMTLYLCRNKCESVLEEVERIFKNEEICFFIKKQHQFYIGFMKTGLEALKSENLKNKKLMKVTEEELRQFGYHDYGTYKSKNYKE